ncbi:MAG: alpha/beta hydrolase [Pseudomonadota bacterium]|nr:alpha/beta hydrolase [Pseudomonadota bacterium]
MSLHLALALAGALCVALPALVAHAKPAPAIAVGATSPDGSNRLFADSQLIVRDRISVEVVGAGPDLIFIPGLASSRDTWRATAERLRDRYRLHLVQVAGFAGEPARANAAGPVLIPTAEAIDAYILDQKLSPATVIGHSMGGTIALWLAEHHPADLKKVLIVDAVPFFAQVMMDPATTPEQARPMAERLRTAAPRSDAAMTKMIDYMVTSPADRARVAAWSKASDHAVVQNALADDLELDLRPGLAAIGAPITVLFPDYVALGVPAGATDATYGAAFAALPRKTMKRVDGSLHFIMFDQPAVFAADLDAFLAS